MWLIGNQRDIIIVTGCNAIGKTTTTNYLREWASKQNIPYEKSIIADSQCLFEAMQKDDRTHGLHHTHDWCEPGDQGHVHDHVIDRPVFPFTVTDNELPDRMRKSFFKKLAKLPSTNKFWFVEWAGGVNIKPDSPINYSYSHVKCMLEKGNIPATWLKRVKAVIHVTATNEVRFALNKQILGFYDEDDFSEIEVLLGNAGITISMIKNNGSSSFFEDLETVANKIFLSESDAVAKSPKTSSTSAEVAKTVLSISGFWAALHGVSMLSFGASAKNTKADILPASAIASYLEEQE